MCVWIALHYNCRRPSALIDWLIDRNNIKTSSYANLSRRRQRNLHRYIYWIHIYFAAPYANTLCCTAICRGEIYYMFSENDLNWTFGEYKRAVGIAAEKSPFIIQRIWWKIKIPTKKKLTPGLWPFYKCNKYNVGGLAL